MKKIFALLVVLVSLSAFGQTWSGQSSSDARVVPPYHFCLGQDNGQDACFIQSGSLIARLNGQLDFILVAKTVATLPAAATNTGRLYRVTDGTSTSDCTVGGSNVSAVCVSNGTTWQAMGGGGGGISGLTLGYIPQAGSATTIVNSSPLLDNGITHANGLNYAGTAGILAALFTASGANTGTFSLGCSGTSPIVGSGIAFSAPSGCTPYTVIPPNIACSGYWQFSNSAGIDTITCEAAINLNSGDVTGILPVAQGGTGNAAASGALTNLFPPVIRKGDLIWWNGSAWINLGGYNIPSTTGFPAENGNGVLSWITSPLPLVDGGTNSTNPTPVSGTGVTVSGTWPNNTFATSNVIPQVGTPTVNQAVCVKSAGPPVVIGYCSTVVGAGGACTCN